MTTREAAHLRDARIGQSPERAFKRLLDHARFEDFEPGMDSDLSRGLQAALDGPQHDAIMALADEYVNDPATNAVIANEIVRYLGHRADPASETARMRILVSALRHPDPFLHDAAALALVDLGNPTAREAISHAAACEPIPSLRDELLAAANELS